MIKTFTQFFPIRVNVSCVATDASYLNATALYSPQADAVSQPVLRHIFVDGLDDLQLVR